jgi:hypothetical protein
VNWKEASNLCDEIVEMIDDDISEDAYDRAEDFFDGVRARAVSMQEWIDDAERVTPKMVDALTKMKQSVKAWIRDE